MPLALLLAVALGPAGDAFYAPLTPLPVQTHGAAIWARPFSGGPALVSAATNQRLLYSTVSPQGTLTAVSGTVAIPHGSPPPQGWPLLVWAHGTVGNGPQCAPSRAPAPDVEQRMLDGFVARGFAVAQTDYEGNGTPGNHPYLVAAASARDLTDMALAARDLEPAIGKRWVAMGHSEGGDAALAAAAFPQTQWAPEMQLLGAVSYAPLSFPQDLLRGELHNDAPNPGEVVLALTIDGFAAVDPQVDPSQMLEPGALALMPDLYRQCFTDLTQTWSKVVPNAMFRPQGESSVEALDADLRRNDPANFAIAIPTLLVQGGSDASIDPESTRALADRLRRQGTPVTLATYLSATHGSVLAASAADVAAWLARRFAGSGESGR
ncbi:MAG TPA: lipase family protein [Candidatus Acidoferrales bacterium]|nr:lipase family protein [Candidatus Acidoferrales bacterium]